MDALLNRAADHGADLLAIGAFGGGGYPLFSRGGGSRYMLKHMTRRCCFRTERTEKPRASGALMQAFRKGAASLADADAAAADVIAPFVIDRTTLDPASAAVAGAA